MIKYDLKKIIEERYPEFNRKPRILRDPVIKVIEKILYIKEVNKIIEDYREVQGLSFIDELFEYLNFSFIISHKDIKKIPAEGRLLCVANHPIGSLDGLSLLKAVSEVRKDTKIIANDILYSIENLREHFLPFNIESSLIQRRNIEEIGKCLNREEAIILFPAGEVSRLQLLTVSDKKWTKGAVYFASKFNTPVLPLFVDAKNSPLFYLISTINKQLSTLLLVHEMFNKKNRTISIKIGDPIPAKVFATQLMNQKVQSNLLRKHVYSVGRGKSPVFFTEKNIIHPIDRQLLNKELNDAQLLGLTHDKKKIILTYYDQSPAVLNEIGRLREVTFRKVGEGTGKKYDLDPFDKYYDHLIVWDEKELEIVGAYRIGNGAKILSEYGASGFYTETLFEFEEKFIDEILPRSIELGRSFVQKRYWNTQALHYLWQGIGAYLAHNQKLKYMFGGVSISNNYPEAAKNYIVYYFNKWYGSFNNYASAKNKYVISKQSSERISGYFNGTDSQKDYFILKNLLKPYGFSIPILYKHYSDLCEEGGVEFLDFGVDPDFENCVDGLILVDIHLVKEEKRKRYINQFLEKLRV
jgi:putative hemolysin